MDNQHILQHPNKEDSLETKEIWTDRELSHLLFKEKCKPSSWKWVQREARIGNIRGQQVGRGSWLFHRDAIKDYLMGGPK